MGRVYTVEPVQDTLLGNSEKNRIKRELVVGGTNKLYVAV